MSLLIRNVRLVDGTGAAPVPSVTVEAEHGRITWIGEDAAHPARHSHTEEVDGRGFTLIPGIIDCHEHFTSDGGPDNGEILACRPTGGGHTQSRGQCPSRSPFRHHLGKRRRFQGWYQHPLR